MSVDYTRKTFEFANSATSYNEGLRSYMISVYNNMGIALSITGVLAYLVAAVPALFNAIFGTPLFYVVMFAPLIMAFFVLPKMMNYSIEKARGVLWLFSGLMGISLASIFVMYTSESITRVFFITASTFGAMSLYGYTTKKDLTSWGSFLFMGLIGIILSSLVNLFLQSSALQFVVSIITVVVFVGFTAYDTQRIRSAYDHVAGGEIAQKFAVFGALMLYMDFINLFLAMLRLFGDRR
jgi:uncharacterized protein